MTFDTSWGRVDAAVPPSTLAVNEIVNPTRRSER